MTDADDAARMAAGIAAIRQNAARAARPEPDPHAPAPPGNPADPMPGARRLALSVTCPCCRAQPGTPCQITVRRPMTGFHPTRIDTARAAAAPVPQTAPVPPDATYEATGPLF